MGDTYTRQSSYTDGDVITATHTNNEFNQLLAAFAASTGHTHDGTAAEGGPITKLLGNTLTFGAGTAGTDITITFDGETSDGELKWMEDEDYFEFSDDILIASTEKLQFRDTAIYINSSTDGQLDLVADSEIQIAATTIDINGNVDISGTLTIGSAGISEAELEILDGATVTTTELNILDGDTSATSTTVADADRVVFNDAGTMKQVAVTDLAAYFDDEITAMPNLVTTGALDSGSITSGFGTIDTGSSTITTTGLITGGSLDIDDVVINGSTIGHTDDTDLITVANGIATIAGEISVTTLDIGGTNVTSTAAELNILDGVTSTATEINIVDGDTSAGTTAVAGGDGIVTNDGGTMRQTTVDTFDTYLAATTKTLTNKTIDVDNNTVSNIEVDNLKSGVLDTDLSSVAGTDTTLASAKAIKAYVDAQLTASDLDFQGDSGGALSIDLDSETLDIAGGTGIDTSGSSNTLTVAIDSTVATLTGSQTMTNKSLTAPTLTGSSSAAGSILFKEDTDNGTNAVTLIGPASTADVTVTLPSSAGTVALTSDIASAGISSGNVATFTSGAADDDFLRIDGTAIEGRSASEVLSDIGGQAALTFGISNTNAVKIDSSSVADDEFARFTANGLESRSATEVRSDIGLGTAAVAATGISNGNVAVFTSGAADNDFLRIDGTSIEGRSASEVLSDIGATTATLAADEATALAIALG